LTQTARPRKPVDGGPRAGFVQERCSNTLSLKIHVKLPSAILLLSIWSRALVSGQTEPIGADCFGAFSPAIRQNSYIATLHVFKRHIHLWWHLND
jgi:hypothetical protein